MDVTLTSYRDEANQIVDDLNVDDSLINRMVILRNGDGTITIRGTTVLDTDFEETFEVTKNQYTGLMPQSDDPTQLLHDDIQQLLSTVGFTVEPTTVRTANGDSNE